MNGVSAAAQSSQAMADLLKMMSSEQIETAEKLVKFNAEMKMGAEPGKGQSIDLIA